MRDDSQTRSPCNQISAISTREKRDISVMITAVRFSPTMSTLVFTRCVPASAVILLDTVVVKGAIVSSKYSLSKQVEETIVVKGTIVSSKYLLSKQA